MPYVSLRACILVMFLAVAWLMTAQAVGALSGLPLALAFLLSAWAPPALLVVKRSVEQRLGGIQPLN
jgi:hypothetical protein